MSRLLQTATALAMLFAPASDALAERRLTLSQAVAEALRLDPLTAEAHVQVDRSKNAVLRAQLDRITFSVDGTLQELWNKSNLLGPTVYECTYTLNGQTETQSGISPSQCMSVGGTSRPANEQAPSYAQGLFNLSAQANVPLFSGFRVEANVKKAQKLEDAAIVQIRQARKDTALAVGRAYWSVRRLGLLREVQAEALARMKDAEGVTGARVTAGLAPPVEVNTAKLRRLQQEATLADLAGQEREAAVGLAVSLQIPDELVLVDPVVEHAGPLPSVEELLHGATHDRPEMATARLQLEVQEQNIRMAQSTYWPQLNLFGFFQYGNNQFNPAVGARTASQASNPFSGVTGQLTLGASLSYNFFNNLNTWTSVKDARYERARLEEEQRRAARVVEGDVRAAYAKLVHLYGRLAPLALARDVARDNLAIQQGRYQNGEALIVDYLNSEIDLANTELSLADLRAQLQVAWLELDAALGRVVGEAPTEGGM